MVSGQFGAGVPQPCGTPRTSNDAHGWHPTPHSTEPLEFRQSHKPATAPYIRFCGTPEEKHPKSAGIPHHVTPHLQHRTTPHHADTYSCPHLHNSTFLEDGAHMHVPPFAYQTIDATMGAHAPLYRYESVPAVRLSPYCEGRLAGTEHAYSHEHTMPSMDISVRTEPIRTRYSPYSLAMTDQRSAAA